MRLCDFFLGRSLAVSVTTNTSRSRLGRAFLLIATFSIVELVTAIFTNSLTLLADAGHMLLDTAALGLAWLAARLSELPVTRRFTFGYHRAQVLAAFVNGLLLSLLILWILIEGIERLREPHAMLPLPALAVATLGLLVNLIAFRWLGHDRSNINVRAAALHVLGDILGSLAAIASALIVYFTGLVAADALLALIVAAILAVGTWRVIRMSVGVLLEAAPAGLEADTLKEALLGIQGVKDIHRLHIWELTPGHPLAMVYLCCEDGQDQRAIVRRVKTELRQRFGVESSAIEVRDGIRSDR